MAGGGETKGENQHEKERWHNPQGGSAKPKTHSREKTKQRASQRKEDTTYSPVSLSSQITPAAPRLRAEEGVGRTTTKKRTRKTCSPVPQFSDAITQTMAQY